MLFQDQNSNSICDTDEINKVEYLQEEPDPVSCLDACSSDTCSGKYYVACLTQPDGCKDKINKGIIINRCGVECLKGSDCKLNADSICDSDNKCAIPEKPEGLTITVHSRETAYSIQGEASYASLSDEAQEGYIFYILDLTIENDISEIILTGAIESKLKDEDNYKYRCASRATSILSTGLQGYYNPGDVQRGKIVFEIPEDSTPVEYSLNIRLTESFGSIEQTCQISNDFCYNDDII